LLIFCAAAHAEVLELEGTVKAVDATARSITIERKTPKGNKTLELEVTKKAGDLSGVKAGDSISFSYDPDLEIVTKVANPKSTPAKLDAASEEKLARLYLDKLLKAVEEDDYEGFLGNLTKSFQASLTEKAFASGTGQLMPRMKKGYDVTVLGKLKERGFTVHLWKIAYKDGGDDTLARLIVEDEKVSGFLLTPAFAR